MKTKFPHLQIRYSDDNRFVIGSHLHSLYEIYYFHEGRCSYMIGQEIKVLQPGSMLLMNGLTLHRPIYDRSFPYRRTTIHFDREYVQRLASVFPVPLLQPFHGSTHLFIQLSPQEQELFEQKLRILEQLYAFRDDMDFSRFHALFLDLLFMIYSISNNLACRYAGSLGPLENGTIASEVIHYINSHYREEFRLEALEKKLHVSRNHISKVFRETTGISVTDFLNHRRIYQAMLMLQNKIVIRTIENIGYLLGFKTNSHFSRMFKQYTGYTPQQFKLLNLPPPAANGTMNPGDE